MATPAVGQPFIEKTGTDNPLDGIVGSGDMQFVDIDGDGDMDCFFKYEAANTYSAYFDYYENIGDVYNANYALQTAANNPFDGINSELLLTFVDIDDDGDLDAFATAQPYDNLNNKTLSYYENTGSVTAPNLVLRTPANNPLNLFVTAYGNGNSGRPTFVDVDNDGDMDCFMGFFNYSNPTITELVYYENLGTAVAPSYVLGSSNLTGAVNSMLAGSTFPIEIETIFEDMDNDGDLDAFVNGRFLNNSTFEYYQNVGTTTSPSFVSSSTTPLDNISAIHTKTAISLVDIDNDSELDFFARKSTAYGFWENQDSMPVNIDRIDLEVNTIPLGVSPNPTTGELNFDKSVSGQATIYSISGQLMLELELREAQKLNLESLQNGVYFLEIQTEKGRIREKVLIQK
jgi:hypothetical protein